jgi:hypothetical protein
MKRRTLAAAASVALAATLGSAAQAAIDPKLVCVDGVVDREKLAIVALTDQQVSFYPLYWAQRNGEPFGQLPAAVRVLAIPNFCAEPAGATAAGFPKCAEGDAAKINAAQTFFVELLEDPRFANPGHVDAPTYLRATNIRIGCPSAAAIAAAEEAAPTPFKKPDLTKLTLRLRGTTDGLQFRRSTSQFAGVDKATINFTNDEKDDKTTFKTNVIAGLAVPIGREGEIVPYIGYAIDKSKKGKDPTSVSGDTLRAGMLIDYRLVDKAGTFYFLLRPEYMANRKERSEIFTETASFVPVLSWLNDYAWSVRSKDRPLFSIMPRGEIRAALGHFIKQGDRTADVTHDYLRVGGQFGATLSSDVDWLPLDLTVTETYLHGLRGFPRDLSQFKVVFSASLDAKKYFGVDIGYTRGKVEDLLDREHKWTIGFGAKF